MQLKRILLFFCVVSLPFLLRAQYMAGDDTLKQYTGKYTFPEGSIVTEVMITLDSGVLKASSAMGSTDLHLQEGDVFDILAYGGTATFRRNAQNKISGVQILVDDINIEGTKVEDSSQLVLRRWYYKTWDRYTNWSPAP